MPSFAEVVRTHAGLGLDDVAWLQLLQADWQIIADLSFADLVMWVPDREGAGFWAAAQMRPTTGPTALVDDVVGSFAGPQTHPLLARAWTEQRTVREGDPEWRDDVPVRGETIPVRRGDRVIALIERSTNLLGVRTPSRLELTYLESAAEITRMIAEGEFPTPGPRLDHVDSPRVGDGFVRLSADGTVAYASPNAQSVFRRLGLAADLTGESLAGVTRRLVPSRRRPDEETLSAVLGARAARDVEIATDDVAIIARSIPLRSGQRAGGGLVLVRDVTDLRRRDRELVTKDATIREIHHRVKNNLQTVAALLRMQARRMPGEDAKSALEEAVRRVGSIAIVHETLSQSVSEIVDFDAIADRLGSMVGEVSALEGRVRVLRQGTFGDLESEVAGALAMVLTELLQNAVEHGYGQAPPDALGLVRLGVDRDPGGLVITVDDDGVGLPPGFDLDTSTNLGLSIVRTLVESELGGRLQVRPGVHGGTQARIELPPA